MIDETQELGGHVRIALKDRLQVGSILDEHLRDETGHFGPERAIHRSKHVHEHVALVGRESAHERPELLLQAAKVRDRRRRRVHLDVARTQRRRRTGDVDEPQHVEQVIVGLRVGQLELTRHVRIHRLVERIQDGLTRRLLDVVDGRLDEWSLGRVHAL